MSPTQRSLEYLRLKGYPLVAVVKRFIRMHWSVRICSASWTCWRWVLTLSAYRPRQETAGV
jgi:hypothetical protein